MENLGNYMLVAVAVLSAIGSVIVAIRVSRNTNQLKQTQGLSNRAAGQSLRNRGGGGSNPRRRSSDMDVDDDDSLADLAMVGAAMMMASGSSSADSEPAPERAPITPPSRVEYEQAPAYVPDDDSRRSSSFSDSGSSFSGGSDFGGGDSGGGGD